MAKKKITAIVKLQCPAGKATPAPPVGPALGPHGVSAPMFCQQFNDRTKGMEPGLVIPAIITVYQDKSFTFILKTPPASVLIKKACGIEKGSAVPQKDKVAKLSNDSLRRSPSEVRPQCQRHRRRYASYRRNSRSMGVETDMKK